MLKHAHFYKEELIKLSQNLLDDNRYKFFNAYSYVNFDVFNMDDKDEWARIKRVSVVDNEIRGYFRANIDRECNNIDSLAVCNFCLDKNKYLFAKDFSSFIELLFNMNFNKIEFNVIVGNPAERIYDRFIEKHNGRVVGTFRQNVKLNDGRLYDQKFYELFKTDYDNVRKSCD